MSEHEITVRRGKIIPRGDGFRAFEPPANIHQGEDLRMEGDAYRVTTTKQPDVGDDARAEALHEVKGILAALAELNRMHAQAEKLTGQRLANFIGAEKVLGRLAWLLGLSPAERAFVQEAAEKAADLKARDDVFMVFADWLEDQGRGPHAGAVRRLARATPEVAP